MATVPAKLTILRAMVTTRCLWRSEKSVRWSAKTMCSLPTPDLRIRSFSGSRCSNSSDNMIEFGQDFRSKVAISVTTDLFPRRGSGCATEVLNAKGIPFASDAKRALEISTVEACRLGRKSIGSEHLLLGLLRSDRSGQSVSGQILKNLGADYLALRQEVIQMYDDERNKVNVVSGESNEKKKKPATLEKYGTDLTKLAEEGKLDVLNGVQAEIERVVQILCRGINNNPCLIGEDGVAKCFIGGHARHIAKGLAQRIASGDVPDAIKGKKVIQLDMWRIKNERKVGTQFGGILKELRDEIKPSDEIILFLDEQYVLANNVGAKEAAMSTNFMKQALRSSELQCIIATTFDEYKRQIEKDPALERVVPVEVTSPSRDQKTQIMNESGWLGLKLLGKYVKHLFLRAVKEARRKRKREKAEKVARDLVIAINELNKEEIDETSKEEIEELNKVMFVREKEWKSQVLQVIISSWTVNKA